MAAALKQSQRFDITLRHPGIDKDRHANELRLVKAQAQAWQELDNPVPEVVGAQAKQGEGPRQRWSGVIPRRLQGTHSRLINKEQQIRLGIRW